MPSTAGASASSARATQPAPARSSRSSSGAELATAGAVVVSGLAKGIDGAAHRGALRAPSGGPRTVGVVANGLDCAYPREHAALWRAVADDGLLLSEWPPGTAPEKFRFPLRNRVLAALSEVLVVVESRERGGSLTTAREALERSIEVMAVPGAVHNRAAAGTNQLIRDGAQPVTDPSDVLLALGLDHRRAGRRAFDPRPLPRGVEATVLDRCRTGRVHARPHRRRAGCHDERRGDDVGAARALGLGARIGRLVRAGGGDVMLRRP